MRILFLLLPWISLLSETSNLRHVYLTWEKSPTSSITINLHTLPPFEDVDLFYDKCPNSGISSYKHHLHSKGEPFLSDISPRFIHHITIDDLKPGTTYYFRIGDPDMGYSREYKFRLPSTNPDEYRFAIGGDWEIPLEGRAVAEQIAKQSPTAFILGGDYPCGVHSLKDYGKWDLWLDTFKRTMIDPEGHLIPIILAIGNHDVFGAYNQTPEKAPFYYTYFKQNPENKSYFTKTFGDDIAFFILDTGHTASHDQEQLEELKFSLRKYAHIPLKFAIYHVPIYPSVRFTKPSLPCRLIYKFYQMKTAKVIPNIALSKLSIEGEKYWAPLFDQFNLTAAFEHHDHTLKRTKPLRAGQPHPKGTLYFGDGAIAPRLQSTPIQSLLNNYFETALGHVKFFWLIDFQKESIRYRAIDDSGIEIDCLKVPKVL